MINKERIAALLAFIFLVSVAFHVIELTRMGAVQNPTKILWLGLEGSLLKITFFACPFASSGYLSITKGGKQRKMRVVALAVSLSSSFYFWLVLTTFGKWLPLFDFGFRYTS